LSLFAAGIVLFVLLIASYSGRGAWIALGSMALSATLLFGCLFLVSSQDRSQVRTRLAWVASELPLLLDRQTFEQFAASLEPPHAPSPCGAGQPGCSLETTPAPIAAAPPVAEPEPVQAAATAPGWFDAKPDPQTTPQSPVAWQLDERDVQPVTSPWGFSIGGTNVSDQALEQVQAVLKPDSARREMPLALSVDGDETGDGSAIPAKARFGLFSAAPDDGASEQIGGAILTFRYVQAGQRKSSILYLTPAMVARLANRD
jgi:hypothetical protein